MQVRLLTNLVPSKSAGDRSGAADGVIRRLFDVGAGIRVENDGKRSAFYGERVLDIVSYVVVEYLVGV